MARPFTWFSPASVQVLRERLNAASADAHLEVHEEAHGMILYVVEPGISGEQVTEGGGGVNESHTCPPVCP